MKKKSIDLAPLWEKWRKHQDIEARNAIVTVHLQLAARTANHFIPFIPRATRQILERADLEAAAHQGLIRAVTDYDPSRNTKFATYAITLMRGAILEHMRRCDWAPREIRQQQRAANEKSAIGK